MRLWHAHTWANTHFHTPAVTHNPTFSLLFYDGWYQGSGEEERETARLHIAYRVCVSVGVYVCVSVSVCVGIERKRGRGREAELRSSD